MTSAGTRERRLLCGAIAAMWGSAGIRALMNVLNVAYGVQETADVEEISALGGL